MQTQTQVTYKAGLDMVFKLTADYLTYTMHPVANAVMVDTLDSATDPTHHIQILRLHVMYVAEAYAHAHILGHCWFATTPANDSQQAWVI